MSPRSRANAADAAADCCLRAYVGVRTTSGTSEKRGEGRERRGEERRGEEGILEARGDAVRDQ